jgi:hypothetical protein
MANPEGTRDSSARIQIIIALIGLFGVLATAVISNWHSIFPMENAAQTTKSSTPIQSSKKSERQVHSSGQLLVRGSWYCDLDAGAETNSNGDFWWEQVSDVKRFLTPENGAVFFAVGVRDFDTLKYADLEHFSYSTDKIDGNDDPTNDLRKNTVVAYRTREGRLGKFLVTSYGRNLTIRLTTYDK